MEEYYIDLITQRCQAERNNVANLRQQIRYSYSQSSKDYYQARLDAYKEENCEKLRDIRLQSV